MNMTRTQWFSGTIKPIHIGVYEQGTMYPYTGEICDGLWSYWNGDFWGACVATRNEAIIYQEFKSMFQNEPWRGLVEKP